MMIKFGHVWCCILNCEYCHLITIQDATPFPRHHFLIMVAGNLNPFLQVEQKTNITPILMLTCDGIYHRIIWICDRGMSRPGILGWTKRNRSRRLCSRNGRPCQTSKPTISSTASIQEHWRWSFWTATCRQAKHKDAVFLYERPTHHCCTRHSKQSYLDSNKAPESRPE